MTNKQGVIFAICVLVLCYADGRGQESRRGFMYGIGVGGGLNQINSFTDPNPLEQLMDLRTRPAFSTDAKIGYAPSNTLAIYLTGKGFWWRQDEVTFLLGFPGVGLTKYFASSGTGLLLNGGIGLALLDSPFDDELDAATGFGLFGGVGYELTRTSSIETEVLFSYLTTSEQNLATIGIKITLNFVGRL